MRFSNDGSTWSGWESYTTSKSWVLSAGDGVKTVYVQFKDGLGNGSGDFTDTITLDTAPPPTVTIWTAVEIGWDSHTNRRYQVQWTYSLQSSNWFNLGSVVEGNGTTNCVFDTIRDVTSKFYRVLVVE